MRGLATKTAGGVVWIVLSILGCSGSTSPPADGGTSGDSAGTSSSSAVSNESGDDTKTSFVTHMDFVMRHLWGRRKRQAVQRGERLVDGAALDEATASSQPAADELLDLRRLVGTLRTLGTALRALAAERYPVAAQCFDLAMQGIESARQQVDALGLGVERVYDAHELLRRHAAILRQDWESAEQVRVAAERARRKMPREETRS